MWADAQLRAHGVDCRYSDLLWTCWESGPATSIHHEVVTIAPETANQRGQTLREIEQLVAVRGHEIVELQDWWDELDLTPLGFELISDTDTQPAPSPEYRRRGYGRAITWAAINTAPGRPAVLGPSDMAEPLDRSMGFKDFT